MGHGTTLVHAPGSISCNRRRPEEVWRPALEGRGAESGNASVGAAYLLEREFQEVADRASLTARERAALEMTRDGWAEADLPEALGLARSEAARCLQCARAKVRRARINYPYAGLWEVYREEISRM